MPCSSVQQTNSQLLQKKITSLTLWSVCPWDFQVYYILVEEFAFGLIGLLTDSFLQVLLNSLVASPQKAAKKKIISCSTWYVFGTLRNKGPWVSWWLHLLVLKNHKLNICVTVILTNRVTALSSQWFKQSPVFRGGTINPKYWVLLQQNNIFLFFLVNLDMTQIPYPKPLNRQASLVSNEGDFICPLRHNSQSGAFSSSSFQVWHHLLSRGFISLLVGDTLNSS